MTILNLYFIYKHCTPIIKYLNLNLKYCEFSHTACTLQSRKRLLHITNERLQAAVQESTICPLGLIELCEARHGFAKSTQVVASIYPVVEPIDATSCIVMRSHAWLRKAFEPEGQIVDCWNTSWSPSDI